MRDMSFIRSAPLRQQLAIRSWFTLSRNFLLGTAGLLLTLELRQAVTMFYLRSATNSRSSMERQLIMENGYREKLLKEQCTLITHLNNILPAQNSTKSSAARFFIGLFSREEVTLQECRIEGAKITINMEAPSHASIRNFLAKLRTYKPCATCILAALCSQGAYVRATICSGEL